MNHQLISDATQKNEMSIGEEFASWAEQHWNLKAVYTKTALDSNEEQLTYDTVRDCFVKKIDSIISKRLTQRNNP